MINRSETDKVNSNYKLDVAILNLTRKMKYTQEQLFAEASDYAGKRVENFDEMSKEQKVNWLIDLGYSTYSR